MTLQTIAVIGAGAQGRAIVALALRAGLRVVLEDFSVRTLEEAADEIGRIVSRGPTLCTTVEDAIRDADLIIETAADELETKLELFTIFDKFAKPGAIFATTSAQHAVADLAEITACPERCVGLVFKPREKPAGVKVIAGPQTSPTTIDFCLGFARRLALQIEPA